MAIQSFADRTAEAFFVDGTTPKGVGWSTLSRVVVRKLDMLDYAVQLSDLGSPPGNRLETLRGEMKGMYSIRINEQWRIVFRWTGSGPAEVQIRDYRRG
jgi:proteic killer suppression protein